MRATKIGRGSASQQTALLRSSPVLSLQRQFTPFLLALTAAWIGAAETGPAEPALEIAGWRFVQPALPTPLKAGDDYTLSLVSQVAEARTWIVTVGFKRNPGKTARPAVLTLVEDGSILQASLAVRNGRTQEISAAEQARAQGKMKFVIEKDLGARVLLAAPVERSQKGKEIRVLSNVLEIK
ncbi:MAG: hypothetical protein HZA90_01315 [Verrucomicrobia bacterium]|nr:hypothetical protein [Verrucomicrobiota bacterium]